MDYLCRVCVSVSVCLCLSVLYAINVVICRDHTNIIYNITTASDWPYSYASSLRPHTSVCGLKLLAYAALSY
jgi:hypothetical protein